MAAAVAVLYHLYPSPSRRFTADSRHKGIEATMAGEAADQRTGGQRSVPHQPPLHKAAVASLWESPFHMAEAKSL